MRENQLHLPADSRWMCQTMQFWKHMGDIQLGAEMPRWVVNRGAAAEDCSPGPEGMPGSEGGLGRGGMDESSRGGEVTLGGRSKRNS